MKIYRIETSGNYDYVCAHTVIEALQTYSTMTDYNLIDFSPEDDVIEIPQNLWPTLYFKLEGEVDNAGNPKEITFAEFMRTAQEPELFATTAYL